MVVDYLVNLGHLNKRDSVCEADLWCMISWSWWRRDFLGNVSYHKEGEKKIQTIFCFKQQSCRSDIVGASKVIKIIKLSSSREAIAFKAFHILNAILLLHQYDIAASSEAHCYCINKYFTMRSIE